MIIDLGNCQTWWFSLQTDVFVKYNFLQLCLILNSLMNICFLSLRPENQETLLSLSSKMSKHQKQLADVPDTIKVRHSMRLEKSGSFSCIQPLRVRCLETCTNLLVDADMLTSDSQLFVFGDVIKYLFKYKLEMLVLYLSIFHWCNFKFLHDYISEANTANYSALSDSFSYFQETIFYHRTVTRWIYFYLID